MSFLEVRGLCKGYPSGRDRLQVLQGLDIALESGELLAVVGASGSGKSTFLHLVGGMEKADAGSVRIGGTGLEGMSGASLAKFRNLRIGFVFQFHHLLPEFTALENVMFPLLLRRQSFDASRRAAAAWLDEVDLSQRLSHKPGELSGGEQQRVAVARALAGSPDLILADEPTGNLDAATADSVHRLLLALHQRRRFTAIIVTHNPELARMCGKQKEMKDGRLADVPVSGSGADTVGNG